MSASCSRAIVRAVAPSSPRTVRIARYASRPNDIVVGIGDGDATRNAKVAAVLDIDAAEQLAFALCAEVVAARTGRPTWEASA
jgi:hypothetical protein